MKNLIKQQENIKFINTNLAKILKKIKANSNFDFNILYEMVNDSYLGIIDYNNNINFNLNAKIAKAKGANDIEFTKLKINLNNLYLTWQENVNKVLKAIKIILIDSILAYDKFYEMLADYIDSTNNYLKFIAKDLNFLLSTKESEKTT